MATFIGSSFLLISPSCVFFSSRDRKGSEGKAFDEGERGEEGEGVWG